MFLVHLLMKSRSYLPVYIYGSAREVSEAVVFVPAAVEGRAIFHWNQMNSLNATWSHICIL